MKFTDITLEEGEHNVGYGLDYLGQQLGNGFIRAIEGAADAVTGLPAFLAGKIFNNEDALNYAERKFTTDWFDYEKATREFNPSKGWKIAGDVASGIGNSLPSLVVAWATGGIGNAVGGVSQAAIQAASLTALGVSAYGSGVSEAVKKTGELGWKEMGYGYLSGLTEAGTEMLGDFAGWGSGRVLSTVSKQFANDATKAISKSTAWAVVKRLGGDFLGEAFEEGVSALLEPAWGRLTGVDPEAKVDWKDVGYQALVGGLSGVMMGATGSQISSARSVYFGSQAVKNGSVNSILETARSILENQEQVGVSKEVVDTLQDTYNQLKESIAKNGNVVTTPRQKMLLGNLMQINVGALVNPLLQREAINILQNPEAIAQQISSFLTDDKGNKITITADDIRKGVTAMADSGKPYVQQVRSALMHNHVLQGLAILSFTGKLTMQTDAWVQFAAEHPGDITADELQQFVETASEQQKEEIGRLIGVDNWKKASSVEVSEAFARNHDKVMSAMQSAQSAKQAAQGEVKPAPKAFGTNKDGAYDIGDGYIVVKQGNQYRIVNKESGSVTRVMTSKEVNQLLREKTNESLRAEEQRQNTVREEAEQKAREYVPNYDKLSESVKRSVRRTVMQALENNVSPDKTAIFAKVSAKTGLNIVFSRKILTANKRDKDGHIIISTGRYNMHNTVYVNPSASVSEGLLTTLAHETGHWVYNHLSSKGKSMMVELAEKALGEERVNAIRELYTDYYKDSKKSGDELEAIIQDEIQAAYAGELGMNDDLWTEILQEDATLKSRILSFLRRLGNKLGFTQAKTAAEAYAYAFKQAFQRLSAYNQGSNAFEMALNRRQAMYGETGRNNFQYDQKHRQDIDKNYDEKSAMQSKEGINAALDRFTKIWRDVTAIMDSKFLKEWNEKKGRDGNFSVFKEQSGYKYNIELSTMCKKGVPLFEAIDAIVRKELKTQMKTDVIGKQEKEALYRILKTHGYEIPCAICYVEQARQREGAIIKKFLNGDGAKIGWNSTLDEISRKMAEKGVEMTFGKFGRDITTDKYNLKPVEMSAEQSNAFYEALMEITNREIEKSNKSSKTVRPLIKEATPQAFSASLKGNVPTNLALLKALAFEPKSRKYIDSDMLYSSYVTQNVAGVHPMLYSLFNRQGGVSGYKSKQRPVIYLGDILTKGFKAGTVRNAGGIRNQSNSDLQMYLLMDMVQMYADAAAKGYYIHAYTKVPAELKILGLSGAKINASLIPKVHVYRTADGEIDYARTLENAGLGENGELLFDTVEGINPDEAFMIAMDKLYSKSVGTICIGYSDKHIEKLLDDPRVQLIIGFHDNTENPEKRYPGARFAKNYRGLNEAKDASGETKHITFGKYLASAEKKFGYNASTETHKKETTEFNGKTYKYDDIPKLAADMYKAELAEKGWTVAYAAFSNHPNYYKLLADFSLYDSEGHYAPHKKVQLVIPETVPVIGQDGQVEQVDTGTYIERMMRKELETLDNLSADLADDSSTGMLAEMVDAINHIRDEMPKTPIVAEDGRYSLAPVDPVVPTGGWKRSQTFEEVKEQHPDLWDVSADESSEKNPTSVKVTVASYDKIYSFLKDEGFEGKILDASSGLGYGTELGKDKYGFDVEDVEPYPGERHEPDYRDYTKISGQYDVIISNAVLNVLPQDLRDSLVARMGELLAPGGRIFVNVRGEDVMNASSKVILDKDNLEVFISGSGSYQKGFKKSELVAYLKDALGEGYDVEAVTFFGKTSAVVTKSANDDIRYSLPDYIDDLAVKKFGTTDDIKKAAYIIKDGKMLDFSSVMTKGMNPNRPDMWHDSIILAVKDKPSFTERSDATHAYINQGNIRVNFNGSKNMPSIIDMPSFEAVDSLTDDQMETIRDALSQISGKLTIAFDDDSRTNYRYDGNFDSVLDDIRNYYRSNGKQLSDVAMFHEEGRYSLIGYDADDIEVYETSQTILNLPQKQRIAKYLDYLKNDYVGRTAKFVRNGHTYYATMDKTSIRKPVFGDDNSSKAGKKALVKVGADGNIFELIENSKYQSSSPNHKKHTPADYFDYFVKQVWIDNKLFDVLANVEKKYNDKDGYVYTFSLQENKNSAQHNTHPTVVKIAVPRTNSGNSIAQNDDLSTPIEEKNENSSSEEGRNSLSDGYEFKRYTKKEAEEIVNRIMENIEYTESERSYFEDEWDSNIFKPKLIGKSRKQAINQIFEMLNSAPAGERFNPALRIADYLIDNVIMHEIVVGTDASAVAAQFIDAMNQYRHGIHITDQIKSEAKYVFDDKANEIWMQWAAPKGTRGMDPDVIAMEMRSQGIYLGDVDVDAPAQQIFHQLLQHYDHCKSMLDEKAAKIKLREFGSEQALKDYRQGIAKDLLRAYDEFGTISKEGKAVERVRGQYERKLGEQRKGYEKRIDALKGVFEEQKQKLLDKLKNSYKKNQVENRVVDLARKLKDGAIRKYVSSTVLSNPILEKWEKELGKLVLRGNLRKANSRNILLTYEKFYNAKNQPLMDWLAETSEDGKGELDPNVLGAFEVIKNAKKETASGVPLPLSYEELKAAEVILGSAEALFRNYDAAFLEGKRYTTRQLAEDEMKFLMSKEFKKIKHFVKLTQTIQKWFNYTVEPRVVIRMLERYDPKGFLTRMYNEILQGETAAEYQRVQFMLPFEEFFKKNKGYQKRLASATIDFHGETLTLNQAIALYETTKRAQAQKGLACSGFSYEDKDGNTHHVKGTMETNLTDEDYEDNAVWFRKTIESSLTKEDKEFIKLVENFFNVESKNAKTEADLNFLGYTNVLDEFYFPIVRDRTTIARSTMDVRSFLKDVAALNNFSFNKDTKPKAATELHIGNVYDMVQTHAKQMSVYANLAQPMQTFDRVYNKNIGEKTDVRTVRKFVDENIWKGASAYLQKLFSDIQGVVMPNEDFNLFGALRGGYAKYQLGANLKVILSQTASFPTAAIVLSPKAMLRGFFRKIDFKAMDKYCPYAFTRNHDQVVVKAEGVIDKVGKIGDATTKPIQWTDRLTIGVLWNASQAQVQEEKGYVFGTEENMKEAGKLLEQVIRQTQPNYSNTERSAMMRSTHEAAKVFSMFTSAPLKQYSRLVEAAGELSYAVQTKNAKAKADAAKKLGRAISAILIANAMYCMIGQFISWLFKKKRREDEEGNEISFAEDYLTDIAVTTIGMMPGMNQIASYFTKGYGVSGFVYDTVNDFLMDSKNIVSLIGKAASGQPVERYEFGSVLRRSVYTAGELTGIPVRNIMNTVTGMMRRFAPEAGYAVDSFFYATDYRTDLSEYMNHGNTDMAEYLLKLYTKDNTGTMSKEARDVLLNLYTQGYDVLPKAVGNTLSYTYTDANGETKTESYKLTANQKKQFKYLYSKANPVIESMLNDRVFKKLSEEDQAKAIKSVNTAYFMMAKDEVTKTKTTNNTLLTFFRKDIGKFATVLAGLNEIGTDKDKKGNAISGTKKKNVYKYLTTSGLSKQEAVYVMAVKGYTLSGLPVSEESATTMLLKYIMSLPVTQAEKAAIAERCGFTVKGNRILRKKS
ncbi:MAG: hypothetical protein IJU20_08110 [Clostridia bacterium]|nr:hypothetical protein [Clostridia bacterium]